MSDFHTFALVKGRKPHRCNQCGKPIEAGIEHRKCAQVWEGDFLAYREHMDCFAAWNELNFGPDMRRLDGWDGAMWLGEDDELYPEDKQWLAEVYPEVAARLGVLNHKPTEGHGNDSPTRA